MFSNYDLLRSGKYMQMRCVHRSVYCLGGSDGIARLSVIGPGRRQISLGQKEVR